MLNPARRARLFVLFWLAWAAILLSSYFSQLWRLLPPGPAGWSRILPPGTPWRGLCLVLLLALVLVAMYRWAAIRHRRQAGLVILGCSAIFCGLTLSGQLGPFLNARGLPALREAAVRNLSGLAGAAFVTLAALCAGQLICRLLRWQVGNWSEALLYHLGIGFGVVAYLSFGLAALKMYYSPAVWVLLAALVFTGAMAWARWPDLRPWRVYAGQRSGGARAGRADGVWQWFALSALLIAAVGALAPEQEYDALWYHLWLPKLWLQHGQAVDVIHEYISLYPLTWELVFGAGLATGGQISAKLLHLICLPLGALLVYQLTTRYLPRASAWLAVALFVTVPIIVWEATTTDVDLALAFYAGLAVYAVLRYLDERSHSWFAVAVLSMGLASAVKHLGLILLAFLTVGMALRLWLIERDLRKALLPAASFGLLSLLLPLPWYARAWLASGNPVFPDLYRLFGARPAWRWDNISESRWRLILAGFGRPPTFWNLVTLPWDMTVHAARYKGTLGPVFLLVLAPLAFLRRRAWVVRWLAIFCLLYLGVWVSGLNGPQMRFVVPLVPFLAALAAEGLGRTARLFSNTGAGKAALVPGAVVALLLVLNLPIFVPLHEADRVGWQGWLPFAVRQMPWSVVAGRQTAEDYLTGALPSYGVWRYINTYLPAGVRVLTFSGGDQYYSERDRLWSDAALAYPAVWGAPTGHESGALRALHDLGITHILFDRRQLEQMAPGSLAIAESSFRARWCERLYEDHGFLLCRLAWERPG